MPGIARTICFLALYGLASSAAADAPGTPGDTHFDLITRYVQRINNIYDGTWAYTYTVTDRRRDEVRVRRVDPSEADFHDRDRLLSVNGQPPHGAPPGTAQPPIGKARTAAAA